MRIVLLRFSPLLLCALMGACTGTIEPDPVAPAPAVDTMRFLRRAYTYFNFQRFVTAVIYGDLPRNSDSLVIEAGRLADENMTPGTLQIRVSRETWLERITPDKHRYYLETGYTDNVLVTLVD